jgi:hypothetical protein
VIYADILFISFLAAVLVKYTLSTLHVVFFCATGLNNQEYLYPSGRFSFRLFHAGIMQLRILFIRCSPLRMEILQDIVQKLQKEKGQRVIEVTLILDVKGTVPRDFSLQVFS